MPEATIVNQAFEAAMVTLTKAGAHEAARVVAEAASRVMEGAGSPMAGYWSLRADRAAVQAGTFGDVFAAAVDVDSILGDVGGAP